jgi:hypothetical protein
MYYDLYVYIFFYICLISSFVFACCYIYDTNKTNINKKNIANAVQISENQTQEPILVESRII